MRLAFVVTALFLVLAGSAGAGRVVGLGGNKNGESVKVDVGDAIVIDLSTAAPATGYRWGVAAVNRGILRPDSTAFIPGMRKSTFVGYDGIQVLIFSAIRRGTTALKLNYRKAGSAVQRTFELKVTVQPAGS